MTQESADKDEALRANPIVAAWIEADQKGRREPYPQCRNCRWPHATVLMCGMGASFGTAIFVGTKVSVDSSSVAYLLDLRQRLSSMHGFHWKDDIFFERRDGNVIVSRIEQFNGCPSIHGWTIPEAEWQSIVRETTAPLPECGASPNDGTAHIDHPLRHFDRTCLACWQETENVVEYTCFPHEVLDALLNWSGAEPSQSVLAIAVDKWHDELKAERDKIEAPLSASGSSPYDVAADAVNEVAEAAQEAFRLAGFEPGEWDSDNIVTDVSRGIAADIARMGELIRELRARIAATPSTTGNSDHADAERWRAFCSLWAASTEMKVAQDENGEWSIMQVEDVEGERFGKLTGATPDAAIDGAVSASGALPK